MNNELALSRRGLIQRAILLAGGTLVGGVLTSCATTPEASPPGTYFSTDQLALLDEVSELMIPETDTPGARSAGVPQYMDRMIAQWGSRETQAQFDTALDEIETRSQSQHQRPFLQLTHQERLLVLTAHDGVELAKPNSDYARLKELVMTTYYLSQPGATKELRFEPVPGAYRGDIPVSEVGRAWAY